MSTKANRLTIPTIKRLFESQSLTPTQLSTFCHALASQTNPTLNIFSSIAPLSSVLEQAEQSTQRYERGNPKSPLDGVPISIKSNIATSEFSLMANSDILNGVCGYDSILIQKLKDAGSIIIGQTNMDEFGMGSLGHNCHRGRGYTINPSPVLIEYKDDYSLEKYLHGVRNAQFPDSITDMIMDLDMGDAGMKHLSTGGSSSGSAASVSLGSSMLSIGTDTGGSIRLPSAWCGVVGLKPTYGVISRHGIISYASSLDTVGIIGGSVDCVSSCLDVIRNRADRLNSNGDERDSQHLQNIGDSTSCFLGSVLNWKKDPDSSASNSDTLTLNGLKIGIPSAFSIEGCPAKVTHAWEKSIDALEKSGAKIEIVGEESITPEAVKMSLPAYYVLSCAEASSNLARYDGLRYGMSSKESTAMDTGSITSSREEQYSLTRSIGFGSEVQRRILAGAAVLSSDRFHSHYEAAMKIRATITKQFDRVFGGTSSDNAIDLMLIPTALTDPPDLSPESPTPDNTEAFQNDIMTVPISLAGLPSVSVPVLVDAIEDHDGEYSHPVVGMQVFGPKLSEKLIFRAAHVLRDLSA